MILIFQPKEAIRLVERGSYAIKRRKTPISVQLCASLTELLSLRPLEGCKVQWTLGAITLFQSRYLHK
jgi:hypothetical protein